jgi:hypothetical protein
MPHAFKATPGHPAVDYLVRLHADLDGKILENKKEGERLAESMRCVEHFLPAALDMLRKSPAPLTAREIADRLLLAKGARADTSPKALRNFIAAVQTSLVNQNDETIVPVAALRLL